MENTMNTTDITVGAIVVGVIGHKLGLFQKLAGIAKGSPAIIAPPQRTAPAPGQQPQTQQRKLVPSDLDFDFSVTKQQKKQNKQQGKQG
jgi:hypothetical protein